MANGIRGYWKVTARYNFQIGHTATVIFHVISILTNLIQKLYTVWKFLEVKSVTYI